MNVQTDELATHAILKSLKKDNYLNLITNPFCKAYQCDGKMYRSNKEIENLQKKWKSKETRAYFNFDEPTMNDLNWKALAMATKKMDPGEQTYATKNMWSMMPRLATKSPTSSSNPMEFLFLILVSA
jgi:hypothetical protein